MTNQTPEDLCAFVRKAEAAQAAVNEEIRKASEGGKFADAQHPQGFKEQPLIGPQWFVTFGYGDEEKRNCYWCPQAHDYAAARDETFNKFGRAWAFIYPISDLAQQKADYGLVEWHQ